MLIFVRFRDLNTLKVSMNNRSMSLIIIIRCLMDYYVRAKMPGFDKLFMNLM